MGGGPGDETSGGAAGLGRRKGHHRACWGSQSAPLPFRLTLLSFLYPPLSLLTRPQRWRRSGSQVGWWWRLYWTLMNWGPLGSSRAVCGIECSQGPCPGKAGVLPAEPCCFATPRCVRETAEVGGEGSREPEGVRVCPNIAGAQEVLLACARAAFGGGLWESTEIRVRGSYYWRILGCGGPH